MTAAIVPVWQRHIGDFAGLLHLAPPTVRPSDRLEAVVLALSHDPHARSVFVTDADDRLLGAIPEQRLDADLVKLVLPQPLWLALGELDARDLRRVTKRGGETASDLMTGCLDARAETPLKDIVIPMIREGYAVAALVDDEHRLLGYLNLFEILAELLLQAGGPAKPPAAPK